MSSVIPGELPNSGRCYNLAPLTSFVIAPTSKVHMHLGSMFSHSAPN